MIPGNAGNYSMYGSGDQSTIDTIMFLTLFVIRASVIVMEVFIMKQGKQNPGTQVIYDPEWFNPLSPVYCRSPLEEITVSIPDMGEFRVRHNHITNPGRFEGENIYIPYFWSAYLNGCADSDDGRVLRFK